MTAGFQRKDIPFLILSFFIPLSCFLITQSHSLMFDDAAEFALVVKLGSIAHPPGTPAYVIFGMMWTKIFSVFGTNIIDSLTLLSSVCIATSSLLLYCTFRSIGEKIVSVENIRNYFTYSICAISFATATTSWAWGNTVEVYSFQALALAVTLFSLTKYHFERKLQFIFIAAAGISAGLGNHHLTMILFLPFTPLFFLNSFFIAVEKDDKKKKSKKSDETFLSQLKNVFTQRNFRILAGTTGLLCIFYYAWMLIRAQHDYPFMFGQPDNLSELIYHIRGGVYTKNISSTSGDIISSRLPYFLKLTVFQLFVFLPLFIIGISSIIRKKLYPLFMTILLYFLMLFIYQLNNNQWSSTDAYMLLPFMVFVIPVFYGAIIYSGKKYFPYVISILLVVQIAYNFPLHDRRSYPVSQSLMTLMDKSAPKNSIVLIADWSLLIQFYYYQIVENYRPDIIALNYDFKFTNSRILPTLYPEFYKNIQPEYDRFVEELSKEHPHQVKNTGCDLNTPQLLSSFKTLLQKIQSTATSQNRFLLIDPRANYFFNTTIMTNPAPYVSGCFSSSIPGDRIANENFISLDFPFMKSPMLYTDPAALDKLVDFQAMLDRHIEFYKFANDSLNLIKAQSAHERIISMQREMKKSMSFAYKK